MPCLSPSTYFGLYLLHYTIDFVNKKRIIYDEAWMLSARKKWGGLLMPRSPEVEATRCSSCGGEKDGEGWCSNYCTDDDPQTTISELSGDVRTLKVEV